MKAEYTDSLPYWSALPGAVSTVAWYFERQLSITGAYEATFAQDMNEFNTLKKLNSPLNIKRLKIAALILTGGCILAPFVEKALYFFSAKKHD